jgi:hypothetical protein
MKRAIAIVLIVICFAGCTTGGYSVLIMDENSGADHWDATYEKFNGYKQREITMSDEGSHAFTVEIVTNSGDLRLKIEDSEGNELYTGHEFPSSPFEVTADEGGKYTIRLDADSHSGSFNITWE